MEILLGLKQAMIPRLAGDEAQARQEAFERLCERSGVPQVLRKFPLQTKIELHDEADLQRDLAERQLEAQLSRRYSRLIDRLYQRQVLGREVMDEEEDHLLLPPVPEVQPVEAQDAATPGEAPPPGSVVDVPPPPPSPPPQLDVLDVDSDEAEPKQWPVVPPLRDQWLSGALSTFLAEKESQAKKREEEEEADEEEEEEEADEADEAESEAMVEEVEVEAKVKRKREDDKNDGKEEEETAPPHKKRSRDAKAKSDTDKSPRLTKKSQKEDASCSFRAEQTGTTTLVFYRPRPYYCAARDTEGFVWTGRSLLDEWDSTDDWPGSGFNRMWSLTRPKRLNLKKLAEACERVRNRPPTTTKGALFLARNVRLVRKSAATARLPTYPALLDVETTDSLGDIDDEAESQAYDDDNDEEEVKEEPKEESRRTSKRPRSEVVEGFVPKYGAPPSPPMGNRRRGVVRRKNGRTSRRTPPRARVTRRAAAAAAAAAASSASVSPATESGSTSVAAARATTKPSTTPAATGYYSSSWSSPAPSLSLQSSSSSSSTKSRDSASADRRRITPTTVTALPSSSPSAVSIWPKAQPSSGRPISETTAAVAATTPQPPPPSLSRRTERVVEISFPLTPRTPTLRAGQNGGGSTRLRVVSRDDDEESLSDTDDPFAFPEF